MKIAIIGGGISGCAIYLALKKRLPQPPAPADEHQYTIFEAYDTPRNRPTQITPGEAHSATLVVGGGIGLHPNGVRSLQRLNEDLARDVQRAGHLFKEQRFISAYGWMLARMPCEFSGIQSISLSRHALWNCLRSYVPDDVIVTKRVSQVIANANGRSVVKFADGTSDVEADLIIGADGLRSPTRRALFPDASEDLYPPIFRQVIRPPSRLCRFLIEPMILLSGLVGVGGVMQSDEFKTFIEPSTMNFIFGGNGFCGYSFVQSPEVSPERPSTMQAGDTASDNTIMWWSTYQMDSCPDPKSVDKEAILRDLHTRLDSWKDPAIKKILSMAQIQTIFPQNSTPELPTWSRDGVILIGDAAHTLTPTSGQGTCQALEDVECFSMLFAHLLKQIYNTSKNISLCDIATVEKEAIAQTMAKHMEIRQPRVRAIQERAKGFDNNKKNISKVAEFIMYLALFIMGKLPTPAWLTQLWAYDIADEVNNEIQKMGAKNPEV
ncbi:hypothetical protein LOZ61_004778 [Ophidiomyces ophidiicola]|uniref:Uncharacterized protein n=1 Tax=Ophidiomyces ophidiicola TaxID=1387563 RepID=A0ACB8UUP4_9EURO|nr:uncharacterized protein LOZ57_001331 [Ophidiomyces ophidiicola]KAI1907651.1 hypothetical protein LOZ64_005823 [Ophidiomyces ophidiicola]KAI1909852.1 hypothetical protein LOZ61_004778 [Ophidiomyces ophidiicola]KAI1924995.1 hypothetical protein LOZ60_004357 [Ophidiomyces ophidiicola]KAI1950771.1 hypothetical protein LOZ59_005743 [Ophidiomyces ophidiicola]KAI1951918.1 hypothetical protein LOZ57_001331 [Ophidiomyces ophidiicola]